MTDFGSVVEKKLGELISRRSLIDNPLGLESGSASEVKSQANQISNGIQDAVGDSESVTETVGNAVESAGNVAQGVSERITGAVANVPNFYTIGLWNYCEGFAKETGIEVINCTASSSAFWFNFTDVLGLQNSWTDELFPNQYESVVKIFKSVSKGTSAFFILSVTANVLTVVIGLAATLSRWGSLLTTILAGASAVFNLVRLVLGIAGYLLLAGVFKLSLNGISVTLGKRMLETSCLATGLSITASLFWLLSSCCCSGK